MSRYPGFWQWLKRGKKYLHFLTSEFIIIRVACVDDNTAGPPRKKQDDPYIKARSVHLPLFNHMRGQTMVFREKRYDKDSAIYPVG